MCNCIKEIKEDLKAKYLAKDKVKDVTNVSIENIALMFGDGGSQLELYSPLVIETDYLNAKGAVKHKKEKASMSYKYCPFCGESYKGGYK